MNLFYLFEQKLKFTIECVCAYSANLVNQQVDSVISQRVMRVCLRFKWLFERGLKLAWVNVYRVNQKYRTKCLDNFRIATDRKNKNNSKISAFIENVYQLISFNKKFSLRFLISFWRTASMDFSVLSTVFDYFKTFKLF